MVYVYGKVLQNKRMVSRLQKGALALVMIVAILASSISLPGISEAKGGVKNDPVPTNCDSIQDFSVAPGQYVGGYAIGVTFNERQCVSGKTITKITGRNTATNRIEFSTPGDFDKNAIYFYGVKAATTYEIKITINRASDNALIGTQSVYVTTADSLLL